MGNGVSKLYPLGILIILFSVLMTSNQADAFQKASCQLEFLNLGSVKSDILPATANKSDNSVRAIPIIKSPFLTIEQDSYYHGHTDLISYQKAVMNSLIETIDQKSLRSFPPPTDVTAKVRATRNDFLKVLYESQMVEADTLSLALSDKMIVAELLKHYLGDKYLDYHPKTYGLVSFLAKYKLINPNTGEVEASKSEIEDVLRQEFPGGFIIKPTTGWSSKGRTFFKDPDEVVEFLTKGNPELYESDHYLSAFFSDAVDATVSGERFIIQATLGLSEGLKPKDSQAESLREFRSHSLWGNFVPDGTKGRWIGARPDKTLKNDVARFLQDFLDSLPKGLRQGQAWSYDILEIEKGKYSIVEVNTNRGKEGHWSGSLHNPKIIGAYVRHLEKTYSWKFKSFSGVLLRWDMSNRGRWVEHQRATRESHNGN